MNFTLRIRLQTTAEQNARLLALQSAFAAVCNNLAPLVQRTTCWNRVALHHLAYRDLRQQFPALGSQLICNAVYSVSKACRHVYQHPDSPFHLQRMAGKPLPLLKFLPQSPVYFDRHTLSLRNGQASMYTLDGRMRFNLPLSAEDEQRFRTSKLREIVLTSSEEGFALLFSFARTDAARADEHPDDELVQDEFPQHVVVMDDPLPPEHLLATADRAAPPAASTARTIPQN